MRKITRQELKTFFKNVDYRHYICIGITLCFVLMLVFVFPHAVPRLWESLRDFGLSIAFYFTNLFGFSGLISPSVTSLSKMPFSLPDFFPATWEEFKIKFVAYWQAWADGQNFLDYIFSLRKGALIFAYVMTFLIPLFLIVVLVIRKMLKKQNNRYNEDTKPLKEFKKFSDKTYRPAKAWILSFIDFIKGYKLYFPSKKLRRGDVPQEPSGIAYWEIWAFIGLLAFNGITIFFELIAYYYYFVFSFDVLSLYTQVYKLLLDLSVVIKFVPVPVWVVLGLIIFELLRKRRGYDELWHHELMNRGFINERNVFSIAVAPMRKGKDKFMTSMALSKEAMYREQCVKIMQRADLKFPYFPWIVFERNIFKAVERGIIVNLAQMREYVRHVERCFSISLKKRTAGKACRRYLKRTYGYTGKNLCYDYDINRYPLEYDNAKYIEKLFDVLCDYGQAFFIYIVRTSLIFSNYPIRVDSQLQSVGNFPLWDDEFFHVRSRDVEARSRFCKNLNWNFIRLGKKLGSEPDFAFEFGIINITEIGKERPNKVESEGIKKISYETNPKNDGFNDEVKIVGHGGTVDYYCFADINGNDQRDEAVPATLLGAGEILRIEENEKDKNTLPLFFVEEVFHDLISKIFNKLFRLQRFNKGNNTLLYYILHTIISKYDGFYCRRVGTFGYERMTISVQDGNKQNEKIKHFYYISNKKDLSNRYATDCFGDVLAIKGLKATKGIDDIDSFDNVRLSDKNSRYQNAYLYPRIVSQVNGKYDYLEENSSVDEKQATTKKGKKYVN